MSYEEVYERDMTNPKECISDMLWGVFISNEKWAMRFYIYKGKKIYGKI